MKSTALSAAFWSDFESESGRYQLATKGTSQASELIILYVVKVDKTVL
ncbi:hypothetical protein MtrunA17_Chr3g0088431 [Medicago truncatula]|uniref:Uncharacterized protein n=1 Tax=Medicago truncatula TaxID=3880 RepID=A0A396IKZ6_MEDTR|nr:hypothetical protein MtrunA17_Chr3g0088431 [Medicago truncatula]